MKKITYQGVEGSFSHIVAKDILAKILLAKKARLAAKAAKIYNLKILKKNIGDDPNNWTRFFIVSTLQNSSKNANKSSLIFSLTHEPGSLYHALRIFADAEINLTKIESRPLPNKPFEYFFYVDFSFDNGCLADVSKMLRTLKQKTRLLKTLGFYS